jgi:hypothetical protein
LKQEIIDTAFERWKLPKFNVFVKKFFKSNKNQNKIPNWKGWLIYCSAVLEGYESAAGNEKARARRACMSVADGRHGARGGLEAPYQKLS